MAFDPRAFAAFSQIGCYHSGSRTFALELIGEVLPLSFLTRIRLNRLAICAMRKVSVESV